MRLVDLETAKTLQRLGYDEEYSCVYAKHKADRDCYHLLRKDELDRFIWKNICKAPRLDDVAYWIRGRFNIMITILWENPYYATEKAKRGYLFMIHKMDKTTNANDYSYAPEPLSKYNDALECAIKKVIGDIINPNK